jgi:predicted DNA-binding transcriptional regulator YafY
MRTMRAARLIMKMVLLLQSRPSMTAAELARELEVSERTITRDAQALSEAGVPVYADRGRAGGYRLIGGYRTRLTGLARSEAEALFLSGVPGALREMGLEDAASAARLKVSAALLPSLRTPPARRPSGSTWTPPPGSPSPRRPSCCPPSRTRCGTTGGSPRATGARRPTWSGSWSRTGSSSRRASGTCARRVPDPGSFRVYRIDRFTSVEPGDERFVRDEEFDLPALLGGAGGAVRALDPAGEVVVRLTEAGARRLRYTVDPLSAQEALAAAGPPDDGGPGDGHAAGRVDEVAYTQLLSLGPEVEVLEPPELRERFAEAAAAATAAYYR